MGLKTLTSMALGLLLVAAQADASGTLYGTVVLRDGGEVVGALRWDGEEVLWIHHFNGDKASPFDLDELDAGDRQQVLGAQPGPQIEVNGHIVELARWLGGSGLRAQSFGIEFGAISELEPRGGDRANITLRDGSVIEADGGSNDIGEPDIEVMVGDGSRRSIDWSDIDRIRFAPAPAAAPRFAPHLYGRVETEAGVFEGFVEWDHDERRADERLDGEVDGVDEEIEFGSIRAIAKEGEGSRVTLTDGVSKLLVGTNDVDSDNRGIVVTGPAFGQVDIPWTAFRAVTFGPAPETLPEYADFASLGPLRGSVATREGRRHDGELVFDLDQFHQAETLEGRHGGILHRVPLHLTRAIEPLDARRSRVELRSGIDLVLGVRNDVTEDNNGIVVRGGGARVYVPWGDVQRLEFTP